MAFLPPGITTPCCHRPPVSHYSHRENGWWLKPEHRRIPGADNDLAVECSCGKFWSLSPLTVQEAEDASRRQVGLWSDA